jgi:RimJ/RimL family protein N-acetyltransferase
MIKFEKFTETDFNRFISWIDSERFMYQFAGSGFTFPITKSQLNHYISEEFRYIYRVIDIELNKVIGHGEINKIDLRNKKARLCRILVGNKTDRNKGYGEQIINGLLEIGFVDLGLHRLDLGVFDFNISAIKCYEKCGFRTEGLFRDYFVIENDFYSVYNMSILRDEWIKNKEVKAGRDL